MSEHDTSAIQPASSNLSTLGGSESGKEPMNATHALTPITGTNGYQQLISFDRSQPLSLSVTNASGNVFVSGSDQDGVWVVVRRSDGLDGGAPEDIPVTVGVDGNTISIHPDWTVAGGFANLARKIKDQLQHGLNPSDWDISNLKLNPDLNFDIRVELPRELLEGSKVSAKTASGALAIANLVSDVSAVTASGRIEASSLVGHVSAHSASGSIAVDTVDGSLEANAVSGKTTIRHGDAWTSLRSVSGGIDVDEFTMKYARIASVSGSVKARFTADNNQTYAFSTVSGSVKLDVTTPEGVTARLTSKSASGSAHASGEWVSTGR